MIDENSISLAMKKIALQESKLKTKIVEVAYWDCGIDNHRHKTKSVCLKCKTKNMNKTPMKNRNEKKFNSLMKKISATKKVIQGETLKEVGLYYGVTGSRISHYVSLIMRSIRNPKYGLIDDDNPIRKYHMNVRTIRFYKGELIPIINRYRDLQVDMYHDSLPIKPNNKRKSI